MLELLALLVRHQDPFAVQAVGAAQPSRYEATFGAFAHNAIAIICDLFLLSSLEHEETDQDHF